MNDKTKIFLENQAGKCDDDLIKSIHAGLIKDYPEIKVRWSRIHGKRWSHIGGNSREAWYGSRQYRLNSEYGICIDNADEINPDELESLINCVRECLAQ